MTIHHAIVAFPTLDAPETIEAVRRAFDPQAPLVRAHITLVFPFVAPQKMTELHEHISSQLAAVSPFVVTLAPPTAEEGQYLYLRVVSGRQRIIELHDRLYSGPLRAHLSPTHVYEPHVTVGRLPSLEALAAAVGSAREQLPTPVRASIESVAVFCIEDGAGRVECTVPLAPSE